MNTRPEQRHSRGIRWLWHRSKQTLRHEGMGSFLLRSTAFMGYRVSIWFVGWYVRPLDRPIEPVDARLDAIVSELATGDVDEYLRFHSNLSREQYLRRLNERQTCFAARDSAGTLASVTWAAVRHVWIDFVDRDVGLEDDEVYLYDSYTAPDFRGQRLQPFLGQRILTHFRDCDYRQAVVIIAPENRSNISSRKRSGFFRTGWLFRIQIGALRRDFFAGTRRPGRVA